MQIYNMFGAFSTLFPKRIEVVDVKSVMLWKNLSRVDRVDSYKQSTIQQCECILFSNTYQLFTNINNILGHKIGLNKNTEIIKSMLSGHNGVKLETITKQHMENP